MSSEKNSSYGVWSRKYGMHNDTLLPLPLGVVGYQNPREMLEEIFIYQGPLFVLCTFSWTVTVPM